MSSQLPAGITFGGAATLLFITLKLTHVITLSWWWILIPIFVLN
jgi:hypothetical protein